MGQYKYLAGIIPVVFIEFLIIVAVVFAIKRKYAATHNTSGTSFVAGLPVESTYSGFNGKLSGDVLLFITRVLSLIWFVGIATIWNYIIHGKIWFFFTLWNVELIGFYFICSSFISLVNIYFKLSRGSDHIIDWSPRFLRFSFFVQILFEVCGATALFVTLVDFVLLNPDPQFWNVACHLVNTVAMVLELLQNKMIVKWEHLVFNVAWAGLYLCFIIPIKKEGIIHRWPYSFLDLSNPGCFAWYSVLLLVNIVIYLLWYGIALTVDRYLHKKSGFERHDSMTIFIGGVEVNSKHGSAFNSSDYCEWGDVGGSSAIEEHLIGGTTMNDFETISPQHSPIPNA